MKNIFLLLFVLNFFCSCLENTEEATTTSDKGQPEEKKTPETTDSAENVKKISEKYPCLYENNCILTYFGDEACSPCDFSDSSVQCISIEGNREMEIIREKKYGRVSCKPCESQEQTYICDCEKNNCQKTLINIEKEEGKCVSEDNCVLRSISGPCGSCDFSSDTIQCITTEYEKKLLEIWNARYGGINCLPCNLSDQNYICKCDETVCKKQPVSQVTAETSTGETGF